MENYVRGVAVLDAEGAVHFASGLGTDPILARDLAGRWIARAQRPVPALFTLDYLDEPLSVCSCSLHDSACFLIYRHTASDPLFEFVNSVEFAADILRHFITSPYEAITVVDAEGVLRYLSPVHEKFFNLPRGAGAGRPAREVIENTRLDAVLRTGKAEIGQAQEMHGTTRVVSRTPIFNTQRRVVGAIGQVMFKSPDAIQQMSSEIFRLRKEVDFYKRELSSLQRQNHSLDSIVGTSEAVARLKEQILKIAPLDVPVLLLGESGVGKDLVAHAIHSLSPRARDPLVVINAAALPVSLVESELFGYEGGAFTGAERKGRRGKFEQADQGSLFLDEIGDMPLEIQVKLLRTLQDGTFQRVGSDTQRRSDFRLISASNRDFSSMLEKGTFRLDLFYRISAVTLRLPALRERLEDIPLLASTFLANFAHRHGTQVKTLDPAAISFLQSLPWPGNVRQLQHAVERAAIFSEHDNIHVDDFETSADNRSTYHLDAVPIVNMPPRQPAMPPKQTMPMKAMKDRMEAELIADVMQRFQGNKKKAAEALGISRSYLYKRLAEIGGDIGSN